ncbi:MAG: GNAT family N-acetyltransferase [Candidatus Limnocylindrales bacterium]
MLTTHELPRGGALSAARALAPPGVAIRRWRGAPDYDAMVDVFRAARLVDATTWEMTVASLDSDVRGFGFLPERTILLAEAGRQVVGWTRAFDFGLAPDDGRMLTHTGHVLPSWRRRGIGHALLAGVQVELLRIRAACADPLGSTAGMHAWISSGNASSIALIEADGYRRFRFLVEMARPLDDLPSIDLPAGLTTRPVTSADRDAVLRALDEAMHDHRGWPAMTADQLRAMFDHPTRGQLDVWQVAWDGDRAVGGVLGYIDADENNTLHRARGYTEGIFTIREWRGRGVASALIARNLALLAERGMTEAALSVDTENPSGALGLYERHGFREDNRLIVFRKELALAG